MGSLPFFPGKALSFFPPPPLYICREEHQVKSLLCSHSCDLNKMNRSAVLTHLPRKHAAEENSSQTPFHLNRLTFILTPLAIHHKEKHCTRMYIVYIHFCRFFSSIKAVSVFRDFVSLISLFFCS